MRRHINEIIKLQWSEFDARAAVRCTIAIAVLLGIGIAIHHPIGGMYAASGAMTVGFGSFQRLNQSRIAPMLYASIGMSLSTLAGIAAGHSIVASAIITFLWGFCYGLLVTLGSGASWIGLQCVIFLIVASGHSINISEIFNRPLLVLAGGLFQTLIIVLLWRLERLPIYEDATQVLLPISGLQNALHILRQHLTLKSPACQYGLKLAVTLFIATTVANQITYNNGYWIPMTAVIVLRQDFHQTFVRAFSRVIGTFIGAFVATLIAAALRPAPFTVALLVVIFAWLCYTLLRVNYGVFSICITSYIVFLLALAGLPEMTVVSSRAINTTIGGVLALLAYTILPPFRGVRKHLIQRFSLKR